MAFLAREQIGVMSGGDEPKAKAEVSDITGICYLHHSGIIRQVFFVHQKYSKTNSRKIRIKIIRATRPTKTDSSFFLLFKSCCRSVADEDNHAAKTACLCDFDCWGITPTLSQRKASA